MAPLQGGKLTIDGDTFEFKFGQQDQPVTFSGSVRTGFLLNGQGSTGIALARDFLDDFKLNNSQSNNNRAGFFLDGGGGVQAWQFEVFAPEGNTDYEWGGYAGADPLTMRDVFTHKAATVRIDSGNTATLETGEYSSQGMFEPQNVVIEQPSLEVNSADPAVHGTVTCLKAADASRVLDGLKQLG